MTGREIMEKKREGFRKKWKNYDKWAEFKYRWWKKEDRPSIPDFSGTGKDFKWPVVYPTGKLTVPEMQKDDRVKIVNNTWRNCFFMQWHVLQEELGAKTASDMIGYMWMAMVAAMEGLNDRYLESQPRDCVMVSKQWQIDCFYEMHDVNVVEETPERVVVQALCTYWADWKQRWSAKGIDIRNGLCDLGCYQWCEEWAYKMNPDIVTTRTKWLVEGDPCCEYVFELKK